MVKVCGVAVAMLPEYSWAPRWPIDYLVKVGTTRQSPDDCPSGTVRRVSLANTDELDLALFKAERRVLEIQTKLHCRARDDARRQFDDLFNLVADPAFLLVAWDRVRGNKGARTA